MKKTSFFAPILVVFILFSAAVVINAAKPADYGLKEGDLISAIFSDDPDVYIINDQGYKRLFLNPEIFKLYSHLGGFANIKLVTPEIRDSFPTSGFFRNCEDNDQKVFGTSVEGEDSGRLHWINKSGDQAVQEDPDFFKKVFCINRKEFNWYPRGNEFKALKEVPQYSRKEDPTPYVICHHPTDDPTTFQTIRVAPEALDAHFQHGDTKGACPTVEKPVVCSPRPACLDATPRCLLSEPPGGWCPPIEIGVAIPAPTPTSTPSVAPTPITVVSPNGGEVFQKGTTQLIKWNSTNVSKIYIKLRKGNDTYPGAEGMITDIISGSGGYYKWWIPTTLPDGNDYSVRVIDGNYTGGFDDSDTPFSIVSMATLTPTPSVPLSITVLSPNGGENLMLGSAYNTTWSSSNVTRIVLDLVDATGRLVFKNLVNVSGNPGNASWTIPTYIPPGQYWMRVGTCSNSVTDCTTTGAEDPVTIYDVSDAPFSIVTVGATTACTDSDGGKNTSVIGMTTGPEWASGTFVTSQDYCITEGEKKGRLAEFYCTENGQVGSITYGSEDGCTRCSGGACITAVTPSITVIYPNGGETWYMGKTYDILWKSSGVEKVYIAAKVYKDSVSVGSLGIASSADNVSATLGKYSWTPNSQHLLEGNQIKIEISNTEIPISGISTPETLPSDDSDNYFSIIDSASTNLSVFSRNLAIGSTGDDVKQLQALLVNEVGYSADLITGYFGRITRDAVKRLQEKFGVNPISGYFGEITRKALSALMSGQ